MFALTSAVATCSWRLSDEEMSVTLTRTVKSCQGAKFVWSQPLLCRSHGKEHLNAIDNFLMNVYRKTRLFQNKANWMLWQFLDIFNDRKLNFNEFRDLHQIITCMILFSIIYFLFESNRTNGTSESTSPCETVDINRYCSQAAETRKRELLLEIVFL